MSWLHALLVSVIDEVGPTSGKELCGCCGWPIEGNHYLGTGVCMRDPTSEPGELEGDGLSDWLDGKKAGYDLGHAAGVEEAEERLEKALEFYMKNDFCVCAQQGGGPCRLCFARTAREGK